MLEHPGRDIVVMVHGNAYLSTADIEDLIGLASMLKEQFEVTTDIIGHGEESKQQIKVLNKSISMKHGGYTYEPDVRHSEMIVKELELQGAKTLTAPM